MGNRKAATAELLRLIDMLLPGSDNAKLWKERLEKLSDSEFDVYMGKLASGEEILSLISPNLAEHKLSVQRNLDIADKLGHKFFQRLWLTDAASGTTYLTPIPYLVVDLPLRRQQQLLQKKIKIPVDTRHVDELTGQPRDESKGSSVTFPEVQVLNAQGLDRSLEEFLKFRGGDEKARIAMERSIVQTGHANQDAIKRTPSRPKSTETLSAFLTGMHLDNNL
jgi:hypothetical protein